jgi:hypothetical protein
MSLATFALDGFWLLAALLAVYLAGVFTSQYVKDKLSGVPSDLRAALKTTEASAVAELTSAKTQAVANVATLLAKGKAAAAAEAAKLAPVTAAAPKTPASASAAPAAPAPAPAAPAA